MAVSKLNPVVASSKTMYRLGLTSGTSWTVPTGVTYVNVTLFGGGGGGGAAEANSGIWGHFGNGGEVQTSTLSTTPGASISYAIGSGGAAGSSSAGGGTGGTTTFTGATSASGGQGGRAGSGTPGRSGNLSRATNWGQGGYSTGSNQNGGAGAAGWIELEYWV